MKVSKSKFDRLLRKLIKAEPAKRENVKPGPKKQAKVIDPKPNPRPRA